LWNDVRNVCAKVPVEDGLRIAFERAGGGPPLVLLHGYVGDGPTTWRRQIDDLSDEFTVVAWDAPGVGRSSDPPESFGLAGTPTAWPVSSTGSA
jgi:pimeloyl-ACP methyl ester carboxylesterase